MQIQRRRVSSDCVTVWQPRLRCLLRSRFNVIVQDIILGEWLPRFVELIESRPLLVVVLAPRPEAVESREANRPKTGYGIWTVEQLDEA